MGPFPKLRGSTCNPWLRHWPCYCGPRLLQKLNKTYHNQAAQSNVSKGYYMAHTSWNNVFLQQLLLRYLEWSVTLPSDITRAAVFWHMIHDVSWNITGGCLRVSIVEFGEIKVSVLNIQIFFFAGSADWNFAPLWSASWWPNADM